MSDLLTDSGDTEDDPRRRATWGLFVLALIATVVVTAMVFFLGTSGGGHHDIGVAATDTATQPARGATETSSGERASPARSLSTSTHPAPTSTANPCPSAVPCAVTGDSGQAVAALNRFRVSHGRPPVPGAASPQAQQCALSEGSGPSCEPHYSWEPVPTQDGARAISLIAGRGDGTQWLLDPGMSSFSVGWAYTPGAGGGPGHYQCAILKVG
ncbi:MAG TPA: hypothetical protein VIM17_08385 [Jatrophihabitantaceae bacterium]